MQAMIFGLMMPIVPLLIRRLYHKDEQLTLRQLGGRYVVYTLITTLFGTVVMMFLCANTSFLEKMDQVPSFVLKFVLIEAVAVGLISLVEWAADTGGVSVAVDWEGYYNLGLIRFFRKVLFPAGCFLLAVLVVWLNFGLMRDNVVWGDEAYAGNAIHNSIEGIFQILTLEENHPPLYYLWLKGFAELFGYTTPVYHLASLVLFFIGIVLALVFLRRHYGNIPTAFFIIISGLSAPCLEYNLEIRMYAMAFLGVAGCYYSISRIFSGSRIAGWAGMVFWGLVAAYAHYYALVTVGIMIFAACVAAQLRYGGKVWVKGVISVAVCVIAYAPWLGQVLRATESVSENWWMTEIETMGQCLTMIGCGESMEKVVLPFLALLTLGLFLAESSIIHIKKAECREEVPGGSEEGQPGEKAVVERKPSEGKYQVRISTPSLRNWSDETYTLAIGFLTIVGTLLFAYGISVLMQPLLTGRYLYPLCAIIAIMLAAASHRVLDKLGGMEGISYKKWLRGGAKCVLVLVLALLFAKGLGNYKAYKELVEYEDRKTAEFLSYIGETDDDTQFVNHGVMHIGWTVLRYYYPDAEISNGSYQEATAGTVWYCTPDLLSEEQLKEVDGMGYQVVGNYGKVQLGKYEFVLYCFEKKIIPLLPKS